MEAKDQGSKKVNESTKKSKRKLKNTLKQIKIEIEHSKICRTQQKSF